MMNRRSFIRTLAVGTATTAGATGIATAGQTATPTASGGGSTHTVGMWTEGSDYYFDPVGLHIAPGDTVTFRIESGGHSATAYADANDAEPRIPESAAAFDSGVLQSEGQTFSHTFETEGTFDYFCTPHKQLGMVGRIVCGEPGGPAEEGSIPNAPSSGVMPDSETIVDEGSVSFPYIPEGDGGSLPWQFWAGTGAVGTAVTVMASKYDRLSGRYGEQNLDGPE